MVVLVALVPILLAGAALAQERPSLSGTVRDRDNGEPIARVLVEAVGTSRHAWSDSLGAYELSLPEPGSQRVRLSRLGYDGLELEVVLPPLGDMRLDVTLRARPVALSGVQLESEREERSPPRAGGDEVPFPEIGTRSYAPGDRYLVPPSGEPDALWATSSSPDVALRPDLPTALHVRGGSADQNLVLLDGVPVLSPHHSGGVLSALPPDALDEVTLHSGVPSARLGGALSSAIEIRTLDVPRRGLASRGGLGTRDWRGSVAHALPGGAGGLLVAGRRSYRTAFPGDDDQGNGFGDLLARGTLDLPGGGIDVLSFASEDHLAFAAAPEGDGEVGVAGASAPVSVPAASSNRYRWSSRAVGIAWRREWPGGARAEVRAWRSTFDATVGWAAEVGGVRLKSAWSDLGSAARMERPLAGGVASGGLSLERLQVGYTVGGPEAPDLPSPGDSLLALDSGAAVLSAFAEQVWSAGERWSFRAGLRGQSDPAGNLLAEPRLSLSFAPAAAVLLSAGYGRTHQIVQSLRNEESILDAITGIDLPVMAGMPGVPVARSDQVTAAVAAQLAAGTTLELDAYARWLDGLVLVAPATSQPFALGGFETGSGRAAGVVLALEHRRPRLVARAAYAVGTVVRRADGVSYHTSYERPRSLSGAVDWRIEDRTRVTAGFQAIAGAPTTPVLGSLTWDPFDRLGRRGELEGSPQRTAGPLNEQRLPPYVRLDLGLRRELGTSWLREGAGLATYLDVLNVLGRRNVVGYALDPDTGARRPLTLLGRALTFGLEWRY